MNNTETEITNLSYKLMGQIQFSTDYYDCDDCAYITIDYIETAKNLLNSNVGDIKKAVVDFAKFVKEIIENCKVKKTLNEKAFFAQSDLQYKVLIEINKKLKELFGENNES